MAKIVGIGANVFDTLYSVDKYPTEDTKTCAKAVKECGGGPCATGLVAASKLGENDTMTGGCLLVLEKPSGEIQTLEIKSREPKDAPTVLYYNDGSKLAYGTTSSVVTGAKGRLS